MKIGKWLVAFLIFEAFSSSALVEVEKDHCKNCEKILFAAKYLAVLHLPIRYFHLRTEL